MARWPRSSLRLDRAFALEQLPGQHLERVDPPVRHRTDRPLRRELRCWEDYDFWLQLACSEQFQFLPWAAVIYQISSSGRFLSSVVSGESAANLRKVVHAVLERLRAREHVSQRFEDDVEAGIVTRIAGQFEMLQELDAKRTYLLTRPAGIPRLAQMCQLRWMLAHAPLSANLSLADQLGQIREFFSPCHRGSRRTRPRPCSGLAADAAASAPGAAAARAAQRGSRPRRHDHDGAPSRDVGHRCHAVLHGGRRVVAGSLAPLTITPMSCSAGMLPSSATGGRRWSRSARARATPSAASQGCGPRAEDPL